MLVILIDSVYRKDENYYPKVFLEKSNFSDNIEYSPIRIFCWKNSNEYK